MKKSSLILKYFQKKDQLTVKNKQYQQTISTLFQWLIDNDKVGNDKTTKYFPNKDTTAIIIAKQNGIIAGLEEVGYLLENYTKLVFNPKINDGSGINNKETIAEITGKSHEILAYERTILNILQRMSGIATETSSLISLITPISQIQIAATRKTPWMSLDKKAVAIGGGLTHRLNLSDGILIKDNHLALISKAIKTPRGWINTIEKVLKTPQGWPAYKDSPGVEETGRLIEIEVTSENQAHQVIKTFQGHKYTCGGIDTNYHLAILLDNFSPSTAKSLLGDLSNPSTSLRTGLYDLSDIVFEASGGITRENIKEWAKTGVDIISLGSLTHSIRAINLSLELKESPQK